MGVFFDSVKVGTNVTISNSGQTATGGTAANSWTGTGPYIVKDNKVYFEFHVDVSVSGDGECGGGVVSKDGADNFLGGGSLNSIAYYNDGTVWSNNVTLSSGLSAFASGDTICCAYDYNAGKAWFRKGASGGWNNDVIANQNPATGTGGLSLSSSTTNTDTMCVAFTPYKAASSGGAVTLKSRQSQWLGTAPAGFSEIFPGCIQYGKGYTNGATGITATLPFTPTTGNRLFTSISGCGTFSDPSGWTAIYSAVSSTQESIYYRDATGSDACTTSMGGAFNAAWISWEVDGADTSSAPVAATASSFNPVTTNPHNSPTLTPSAGADYYLFMHDMIEYNSTSASDLSTPLLESTWSVGPASGNPGTGGTGSGRDPNTLHMAGARVTGDGSTAFGNTNVKYNAAVGSNFRAVGLSQIFSQKIASGGNIYNVTVTEAGTAADALTSVAIFANTRAESGAAADALTSLAVFVNALTETLAAVDSQSAGNFYIDSLTDAGTAADALSVSVVFVSALTESGTAADALTAQAIFVSTLAEVGAALDSPVSTWIGAVSVAETGFVFDTLTGSGGTPIGGTFTNLFQTNFSLTIGAT